MPTESCVINGVKLVYEKEGSGPRVVFIPGAMSSAVQWERVIPFFLADYTCFAFEPRGHGRSAPAADANYQFRALVDEAAEFIRQVAGGPATIVGSSEGGLTAMCVAAHHPEVVRAVYIEDAAPSVGTGEGIPEGLIAALKRVTVALEQSKAEGWTFPRFAAGVVSALPLLAANDPGGVIDLARMFYGTDPVYAETATRADPTYGPAEAKMVEDGLRCPVHIAYGDAALGGIVTEAHLAHLRDVGVNLTATHFPGAGHLITASQLRPFIEDLRAFLARV